MTEWYILMSKKIVVWYFIENISQRIFRDQCERIENIGFNFLEDVIPIFIQKFISIIAKQLITIVQVLEVENNSENEVSFSCKVQTRHRSLFFRRENLLTNLLMYVERQLGIFNDKVIVVVTFYAFTIKCDSYFRID